MDEDGEEMKVDASGVPISPPSTSASSLASSSLKKGPDPAVQFTKQIRLKKSYMSECKDMVHYFRAICVFEGEFVREI